MKKRITAFILACLMITGAPAAVCAKTSGETDYTIVNPYENVDWDSYDTYLANLHTHTTASDGDLTITEMVQAYYDKGYDILAITDHGVINNGWTTERKTYPLFNKFRKVSPMSSEDYIRFTTGADRGGRGITDITGGIECNSCVVSKVHVNGYWTTWGSGVWGTENDYKTATVEIEKSGGYSVLNHVGDWVDSEHHPERSHEDYYINYFADIFTSSKTCLGMEIINNTDRVTQGDRELWDELLQVVIPTGRNIWGFSDDDSEEFDDVGRSFELFPLAANTEENVKQAMLSGAFFSASMYDKTVGREKFDGTGLVPLVKKITVNSEDNTITVVPSEERDCSAIEWIADGKVISDEFTIDLNDFEDSLGCYVRFKLFGEGGVTYSQAFELRYDGREDKQIPDSPIPDNIIGNLFLKFYRTLFWALCDLIEEKIEVKINDIIAGEVC